MRKGVLTWFRLLGEGLRGPGERPRGPSLALPQSRAGVGVGQVGGSVPRFLSVHACAVPSLGPRGSSQALRGVWGDVVHACLSGRSGSWSASCFQSLGQATFDSCGEGLGRVHLKSAVGARDGGGALSVSCVEQCRPAGPGTGSVSVVRAARSQCDAHPGSPVLLSAEENLSCLSVICLSVYLIFVYVKFKVKSGRTQTSYNLYNLQAVLETSSLYFFFCLYTPEIN